MTVSKKKNRASQKERLRRRLIDAETKIKQHSKQISNLLLKVEKAGKGQPGGASCSYDPPTQPRSHAHTWQFPDNTTVKIEDSTPQLRSVPQKPKNHSRHHKSKAKRPSARSEGSANQPTTTLPLNMTSGIPTGPRAGLRGPFNVMAQASDIFKPPFIDSYKPQPKGMPRPPSIDSYRPRSGGAYVPESIDFYRPLYSHKLTPPHQGDFYRPPLGVSHSQYREKDSLSVQTSIPSEKKLNCGGGSSAIEARRADLGTAFGGLAAVDEVADQKSNADGLAKETASSPASLHGTGQAISGIRRPKLRKTSRRSSTWFANRLSPNANKPVPSFLSALSGPGQLVTSGGNHKPSPAASVRPITTASTISMSVRSEPAVHSAVVPMQPAHQSPKPQEANQYFVGNTTLIFLEQELQQIREIEARCNNEREGIEEAG